MRKRFLPNNHSPPPSKDTNNTSPSLNSISSVVTLDTIENSCYNSNQLANFNIPSSTKLHRLRIPEHTSNKLINPSYQQTLISNEYRLKTQSSTQSKVSSTCLSKDSSAPVLSDHSQVKEYFRSIKFNILSLKKRTTPIPEIIPAIKAAHSQPSFHSSQQQYRSRTPSNRYSTHTASSYEDHYQIRPINQVISRSFIHTSNSITNIHPPPPPPPPTIRSSLTSSTYRTSSTPKHSYDESQQKKIHDQYGFIRKPKHKTLVFNKTDQQLHTESSNNIKGSVSPQGRNNTIASLSPSKNKIRLHERIEKILNFSLKKQLDEIVDSIKRRNSSHISATIPTSIAKTVIVTAPKEQRPSILKLPSLPATSNSSPLTLPMRNEESVAQQPYKRPSILKKSVKFTMLDNNHDDSDIDQQYKE